MLDISAFVDNQYLLGIFTFVISYILAVRAYPVVIYLSREKNLMAVPDYRSSHSSITPNLGGVGIFIAFTLTIMIVAGISETIVKNLNEILLLLFGVSIMFFIGVKDDLIGISPFKKLFGQAIAAGLVILASGIQIQSFGGLFGIYELPYLIGVIFSIVLFLFLINAFNLIDGIDGLASVIAIINCMVFGCFFLIFDQIIMMMVAFILMGALIGFLRFNFSSENKLFMGDSGSMVVGFVIIFLATKFLQVIPAGVSGVVLPNKFILILGLLFFPIIDTLRIFIVRILNKKNPFKADKNHIHHRLLDLGLSHLQATLIIALSTIVLLGIIFIVRELPINLQLFILLFIVTAFAFLPWMIGKEKGRVILRPSKFGKMLYAWMIQIHLW